MKKPNRRDFLKTTAGLGAAALAAGPLSKAWAADKPGGKMALGLVTYLWAQKWDLPTLIANCEESKVLGVELRTTHKHGVEPGLGAAARADVKRRFADSPAVLVGLGSAECFDHTDPQRLAKAIDATKAFVQLSHDVGGSGVKVRPNDFHKQVPRDKTIEQIGRSLNVVGKFAADLGQEIRLEVHGGCSELPTIKRIMDFVTEPGVGVCWNSNGTDLTGGGLAHNFDLVKARFGAIAHIRPLDTKGYPWQELVGLFVRMDYAGWLLVEASDKRTDYVAALAGQRQLFEKMRATAQRAV